MADSVTSLINLNAEISEASFESDFSRILRLDTQRREILKSLATNPDFKSDEASLTILKQTAEQNQELITKITDRMTNLTKVTSNKIKMLRSYRMNK